MKLKFIALFFVGFSVFAQENITFQKPSASILALADFQRAPTVSMDSKKEYLLLSYRNTYKTLDELRQDEMRLGGLRINPITNISSSLTYVNNLKLRKCSDKNEVQIAGLPENPKIAYINWSPNEKKITFTNTSSSGVSLWVVDVPTAIATKISDYNLNANLGSPYNWMNDNETLLVKILPQNRALLIDIKKE